MGRRGKRERTSRTKEERTKSQKLLFCLCLVSIHVVYLTQFSARNFLFWLLKILYVFAERKISFPLPFSFQSFFCAKLRVAVSPFPLLFSRKSNIQFAPPTKPAEEKKKGGSYKKKNLVGVLDVRTLVLYAARIAKMPLSFASSLAKMEVEWGRGERGSESPYSFADDDE